MSDADGDDEVINIRVVRVDTDGRSLEWTRTAPDRRDRVRIEEGSWFTTRMLGEVEWLDLHAARTVSTVNPLAPRERDARDDKVASLRDRPPPGSW